jgi:hypothetical protein
VREGRARAGRGRGLGIQFIEKGEGERESPVGFKAAMNGVHQ